MGLVAQRPLVPHIRLPEAHADGDNTEGAEDNVPPLVSCTARAVVDTTASI